MLISVLVAAPRMLLAQEEPTPFWIPDAPSKSGASEEPSTPTHKPATKKRAETQSDEPSRPWHQTKTRKRAETNRDESSDEAPSRVSKRKRKSAPQVAPQQEEHEVERESAPPAKKATKHHYEALPPLPHIEPERPPPQRAAPIAPLAPSRDAPAIDSLPEQPAEPPRRAPNPVVVPKAATIDPDNDGVIEQPERRRQESPPPAPIALSRSQQGSQSHVLAIDEEQHVRSQSDEQPTERASVRRFTLLGLGGAWAKMPSDGQSREWQATYGLSFSVAIVRWLQLDVRGLRSSGSSGNAYASASASHLLFDARLFGVLPLGPVSLFAGGGGGLVIEQTQLVLQDVNAAASSLSSSGTQPVADFGGGLLVQPWRGLTFRLEVDGLIRQGNLELVAVGGIGWAF